MPRKYHRKPKRPPDDHPVFFDGATRLPDGWELLVTEDDARSKFKFTGERIAQNKERRAAVVQALGLGASASMIAQAFKISPNSVAVIAAQEKIPIEDLKKRNAHLMLRTAGMCVESFLQDLCMGLVDPKTKAIAAGIFSQNGLVFAGEPSSIVEERRPGLNIEAINGLIAALPRANGIAIAGPQAKGPVLDLGAPEAGSDGRSDGKEQNAA